MLRYEDPDGDMISFNADDELKEVLRLCRGGTTLKMTLTGAKGSVQQDEPTVDACALSNVFEENLSVSSESGDFEMVETYSHPSSVCVASPPVQPSDMLRVRPADGQDDAAAMASLEAAVMASIEEEHARDAREARDAAEFDALKAAAMAAIALQAGIMASIQEENARVAREAARIAAEGEAARIAAEAEASRVAAEAEARRMAQEEEARRAAVELAERIAAEDAEKKARLEIAFAAADEDALRRANELFSMGGSVDQIRSLYGQSILAKLWPGYWGMQLRLRSSISSIPEKGSVTGVSTMPLNPGAGEFMPNPAATEFVTFAAPAVSAVSEEGDDSDSSLPELIAWSSSVDDSEDDKPVLASPFGFSHKQPEGLHMNGHEFPGP
jgi:hypothetical protein